MKLFEMEGFLRGKCIPGDMKVNETNAEYLVRKFAEAKSKCAALAAENAYLIPKSASELSNAWVLHKYLIGIQAAIMYLDNGNKKAAQEWLYGTIAGPGFEFPDEVDDIDAWAKHQMRGSISHPQALEIIKAETPETETFLAEVRAHDLNAFIRHHSAELDAHIKNGGEQFDEKSVRIRDIIVSARLFREQIRKEAAQ
ncbi:hNH endonuclease [Enterobacter asburiae]|uniref:hNH endonuclease n=1 Tax=Enterobacter asburiae TaxID=61645 RepID=UPI002074B0B6|nr:hNH endonuclease [Enterobacter asburiae]MCM7024002.1 hNH endonuclease [Enterobacter asburiae]